MQKVAKELMELVAKGLWTFAKPTKTETSIKQLECVSDFRTLLDLIRIRENKLI